MMEHAVLSASLAAVGDAVFALNTQCVITNVNKSACLLLE